MYEEKSFGEKIKSAVPIVAIVFVVLGVIGGFLFKTQELTTGGLEEKFNLALMLSLWIGAVVQCFLLYVIGEVVDCLQIANKQRKELIDLLKLNLPETEIKEEKSSFFSSPFK